MSGDTAADGKKPTRGRKRAPAAKKTATGRKVASADAGDSRAAAKPAEASAGRKRAARGGRKKVTTVAESEPE